MSDAKFTPGPWNVQPTYYTHKPSGVQELDGWNIVNKDGKTIVGTEGLYSDKEPDARLIAAAPELLEALQMLLSAIDGNHLTVGDCNEARAAIAKATA